MNDPYLDESDRQLKHPSAEHSSQHTDDICHNKDVLANEAAQTVYASNSEFNSEHSTELQQTIFEDPLVLDNILPKSEFSALASQTAKNHYKPYNSFVLRLTASKDAWAKWERFGLKIRKRKMQEVISKRRGAGITSHHTP